MHLHLISFDIPYPANYGGVIVVYNQIRALHAQGVHIILHCFQYGDRTPQPELNKYCTEVYYYKRSRSPIYQLSTIPFIMRTRMPAALLRRLRKDSHPILFEGMHTCGLIWHKKLRNRKKLVRMHNVEWEYYESLSKLTSDWLDKLYFFSESIKLQRIEPRVLLHSDEILCLSTKDQAYFKMQKANTHFLPAFHPHTQVESLPGRGDYVLFHGKLSVPDNEKAALWLIDRVFARLNIPFIIAGLAPTPHLRDAVARYDHITLEENPAEERMNQLVQQAHINLLVSFQSAGMKLKLLNALYRGRFCIVNDDMIAGNPLGQLCYVRNSSSSIQQTVEALMNAPFEQHRIKERQVVLDRHFSNDKNALQLISRLVF
jgi:hypothetical protein